MGELPALTIVAGVVERDGTLLVTRRRKGTHLADTWEFPGGKVEAGEDLAAALRREFREEVGVEVEVGELLEEIRHAYPERTVHLHFFRCRLRAGEPAPGAACRWVIPRELADLPFPPANAGLIARLVNEVE